MNRQRVISERKRLYLRRERLKDVLVEAPRGESKRLKNRLILSRSKALIFFALHYCERIGKNATSSNEESLKEYEIWKFLKDHNLEVRKSMVTGSLNRLVEVGLVERRTTTLSDRRGLKKEHYVYKVSGEIKPDELEFLLKQADIFIRRDGELLKLRLEFLERTS